MKLLIPFLLSNMMAVHRAFLIAGMFCIMAALPVNGQSSINIYRLMDTTGLTLTEIEVLADQYFQVYGTGKGSGYKHYQRWLYERKFNVDDAGYYIPKSIQNRAFKSFVEAHPNTRSIVAPWNELGPDYWTATSGWNPGNGRLKSIAINPSNPATIYAASPGGGVWKTTNGGGSWNPLVDYENSEWMEMFTLAIDPSSTSKVYAGLQYGGVLKSTDAGSSWDETGFGPEGIKKIVVHPTNTNIVLVASNEGIHRSTNGGNSWTLVSSGGMEDIKFKPGDPNIVYASGGFNMFMRSTNNGVAWTNIGAAGGITHTGRTLIATSPNNPNVVYAVQSDDLIKGFGRLYKSTNSGLNFTTTIIGNPANGTNFFGGLADGTSEGGQAHHDMAICVNPANANEVYIAGVNCWKSTNGGTSFFIISHWNYTNNTIGYNHADIHHLEFVNGSLYSSSDGGIYKSTNNGDDWQDLSEGLAIRQIYRLSCSDLNSNVICIGTQDNGTSARTTSGSWIDWLGADGMDNAISHSSPQVMYGLIQNGSIYKTNNGGQTAEFLPNQPSSGNWVTPISLDPNNHNNLYVGWEGVYKTMNGGTTWTYISAGSITQKLDNLVVAPSDVNFIYASVGPLVYRTSNGGSSWTSVNAGDPVTSIYVSKNDPNKIWITLNDQSAQVKVSENMGTTFTDVSAGLPQLTARCIVVDEDENNGMYVGLNIGVYYLNDNTSDWELFGSDLPVVAINDIEMVKAANLIRVATYGRGVWETSLATTAPVECPESCCESFVSDYSVCNDFESYTTGNIVPQGNPPFSLYNNLPGAQAAISTTQHVSGTKSLRFTATSDIVMTIDRDIEQPTRMEWMTYIPAGKTAAFNFYTTNGYPMEVQYANGQARIFNLSDVQVGAFSYTANSWFKSVIIFFPGSRIEYWQESTLRHTIVNFTDNHISWFNFYYGETGSGEFYLDDLCYREKLLYYPCTLDFDPVCVNGIEYSNGCIAGQLGYSSCEWTAGECEVVEEDCADCDKCFLFVPRYEATNIVDFQSRYCFDELIDVQDVDHNRAATTYLWSVANAAEQYVNGTSATSANPSIQFPGSGSYEVCQQVFESGTLAFECCLTVFVGTCTSPPVAFFTAQEVLFGRFQLNANASGNHILWRLPVDDFFEGTPNSTSPVVVLPGGTCTTVCLYVTNACGTSTYCLEICPDEPDCPGTLPPVWLTSPVTPIIDDNTVEIDLPNPPGGSASYVWNLGDGETATTQDIFHTYADDGNYEVCVTMTIDCRSWCYCWIIPISPCTPVFTHNEGDLGVAFTGSETSLQYTITSGIPKATGESWLVNGMEVNGNSTSLVYTFPAAGNYTVCFPYLGNDGCIHYNCIDIGAGNPFACSNITWQFSAATGYQFTISGGATQISWTIDETGQQIGNGSSSNWVLPVSPCTWRTISVKYFDGARYRICCLRIYLCPPDVCVTSIDYGYLASTNQATFNLNTAGNTDITWYFDDAPSQTLGTGQSLAIPYPGTCASRQISVRYKDSAGRYRICCRLIYFCNPVACTSIRVNYIAGSGYSFTADQAQQQMSWIVEETGTPLGTGLTSSFLPLGATCDYRTISLRYLDPVLGWRLCCARVYWCDPAACGDNISLSESNGSLVLAAPVNLLDVRWYKDATFLGASNPFTTTLSSNAAHNICTRYIDPCDNAWKWCCRTYTPGGSTGNLTFDFGDAVCGEVDQVVDIPLRVRGFTNIINFQLSVQVADTSTGKLISIIKQNISGDFESVISNVQSGGIYWENQSAVTLPDNEIIAIARVRIASAAAGQTSIRLVGNPIPIYAEDGLGNEVIPVLQDGSFCFESLVNICGKITREDFLPIANVNMTLRGCETFHATTDVNGNYCFMDVPSGKSYQVLATKDSNDKNGVNSGDLTAIKRHILNILKLNSPYKIAAADGKKSNAINTGDVSELRRLILSVIPSLPTCESWEFTDKKYVFTTITDPFSTGWPIMIDLANVTQDINNADMIGWKMGDVNNSNNPQSGLMEESIETRSLTDIYLFASSEEVNGLDTFWVDITTRQFTDIINGQFSLRYDPATFELHSTGMYHPLLELSADNFHINQADGSLGFVWDAITSVTVPDDAVLFSLKFTSKVSEFDTSVVYFSQDPVSYYFEHVTGEELNVITSDGMLAVPVRDINTQQLEVLPNPSTGKFYITGLEGYVQRVEVLDARGIQVIGKDNVVDGSNINLELSKAGVYVVRVWQGEDVYVTRVVVIQ